MSKKAWQAIAIGEFLIITAGITFAVSYFAYKAGYISEGTKSIIEILANIAYLCLFIAGSTGWMIIIGLWKGDC